MKTLLKTLSRTWRRNQLNKLNHDAVGGLVIGYEKKGDVEDIYYLSDDVHSLTIGATRSGKSRGIVIQSIAYTALAGESMAINDPKGELTAFCGPYLKRLGYEVVTLDFKNPLKSSRYNFLQPVIDAVNRDDNAKAIDLVWDITSSLVPADEKGERIWNDGQASVIAGAIMSVVFDNRDKPEFQNLSNTYHFILNMCKTEGNDMAINKYMDKLDDSHPAKGLFGVAQIAPSRTRGSFFTAALATLRLFTNENIYNMTSFSDFVLADTGSRQRAIFIILPDEKLTFYSLASLFIYQHYVALTEAADKRGGRLKIRVNFYLDEYGNLTQIPAFSNILTVGGGRGCRFNLFVQSISQIEHKYGKEEAQTITENCHCWIYLKTASNETAAQIAKRLGQYTTSSYSRSSSYNSSGTSSGNVSNSMNLIARSLLTEDEIMRIERPYALVMYVGYFPAIMRLPDLSKWSFNTALGLGDKEHNRKLRELREQARIARKPEPIKLWGIWNEYKPKKRRQTDFGEYGDAPMDDGGGYTGEDVNETIRLPTKVLPGHLDEPFTESDWDGKQETEAAARMNNEMEDMFMSFKGSRLLSKKEKERISKL
jgi:type IV secretion system protein VirD4